MDEDSFWQLIEQCSPSDPDADHADHGDQLAEALTEALAVGPVSTIRGFAEQLAWALYRLDRREFGRDLSADAFLYTRCAVVADGRAVYEGVLADPALIAPYVNGLVWAEDLLYVPDEAYRELTGQEWEYSTRYDYETGSNTDGWAGA
ncbi:DUF4240 domain-containing protein [Catenulispora sp. NF23]|uniref:DUF4240 domain-containing protein n=1 Tax=Catenulispora pinistramenti TaxID=2705254 RepID=A0ABS5KYL2_9ACTN|nr:DUF4240 domain-containing protein [Catenulispora pinistramenti]MBS2539119.1 DUF4240 domain-containing protein [Catenulispora pinistramenti]MBS2551104.1 DUF4240 domain-containing protein [Catenulispora pinistramenti]